MRFSLSRILAAACLIIPIGAHATTPAETGSSFNPLLLTLVSLAFIFIFTIAVLTNVLKQLASAHIEQIRKDKKAGIISSILLLMIALMIPSAASHAQGAVKDAVVAVTGPEMIGGVPANDIYFIIGVLVFEVIIILVLLYQINAMVKVLRNLPEKARVPGVAKQNLMDIFNKSVAIEKEKDIMLDHDYDGIHELDNALPPWWKYGFIVTIIVAFIYLGYYWAAGGPNQVQEYNMSVVKADAEKAAYLAKSANNVDENTVTPVKDAAALATAQATFQTVCAACHLKDGGGNVGPNLTDAYWLHGGGIKDIFKTIKYGWPDKGMKSWKDDYSPMQIAALTTYVKSLSGTHPATAKAPQGELYKEDAAPAAKPADTTAKKVDAQSAAAPVKK